MWHVMESSSYHANDNAMFIFFTMQVSLLTDDHLMPIYKL